MTAAEEYLSRCLELAENGLGRVAPNPMVGCVIVHEDRIIGEGFHRQYGEAHAEVIAINEAIKNHGEKILEKSKLFVSLEPCSHTGKTPPCADLVIEKKIPEVYVGCRDPFPEVNGRGIKKMKDAGISIHEGILEYECREMNRRFICFHEKKRPYIILKWAQSLDGFIAPQKVTGENRWISNAQSRKLTHKWRSEEQAILVGSNTVVIDNPALTVRDWIGKNPLRVVIDPDDVVQQPAGVLDNAAPTLLFSKTKNLKQGISEWKSIDFSGDPEIAVLRELAGRKILSVIVEGGAYTLQRFIDTNLWDEARIFIAGKLLNDGLPAPRIDFNKKTNETVILDDRLFILRNP